MILGLNHQPVDDSYLIEKIQGIHAAETCNRVAPPLETAYDPRKIISCVCGLCRHRDRTEGEGNSGQFGPSS